MKRTLVLIILFSQTAFAQKGVATLEQTWLGYIGQFRLADKWSITADAHMRSRENFVNSLSAGVLRAGLIYHLSEVAHLAGGYAYFHYYPADDHSGVAQPEHRPWQQVQWVTNYTSFRLQQRIRLEERFRHKLKDENELAPGYKFNFRARYQLMGFLPLSKTHFGTHTFSLYGGEEVLLNFGKEIIYNSFDHNRLHVGIVYHINKDDNLHLGYLNIFQQQSIGNRYRMVHVLRIYYNHGIDLRRKA